MSNSHDNAEKNKPVKKMKSQRRRLLTQKRKDVMWRTDPTD